MIIRKKSSEARRFTAIILTLACLGSTACATQTSWQTTWHSPLYQDHELAGKIWLAEQGRFISRDELLTRLQQSSVLLLGEKHDNPDHHRLRLELMHDLLLPGGRSLLVLEMMQRAQQEQIDALAVNDSSQIADNQTLAANLAWDSDGWPWQFYGPVVTLALERGATLRAGNINSSDVMQIYRDDTPNPTQMLDAGQLAQLQRDIDSSHCGMLPASQFPAMVRVQQARDQQMANALVSANDDFDRRILLAGNYHVRHDLGVPNYLDEDTQEHLLSVAFLEVDPELNDPGSHMQPGAYDIVWFTPAIRQDDYCDDMRASQAQ